MDKIDKEFIEQSIHNTFPSLYLTSMSVIQGVALGSLIWNVFTPLKEEVMAVPLWVNTLITFGMILGVWYEYSWFVIMFRWTPTIIDAFIPYLLGASQAGLTFTINQPKMWLILFLPFSFFAFLAFANTYYQTREDLFKVETDTGESAFQLSKAISARNCLYSGLGFATSAIILLGSAYCCSCVSYILLVFIAPITIGLIVGFILWDGANFWYELQKLYNVAPRRSGLFIRFHEFWLKNISRWRPFPKFY